MVVVPETWLGGYLLKLTDPSGSVFEVKDTSLTCRSGFSIPALYILIQRSTFHSSSIVQTVKYILLPALGQTDLPFFVIFFTSCPWDTGRKRRLTTPVWLVFWRAIMRLETIVVGPFEVNCYLYWHEASKDAVVLDPGGNEQLIFEAIDRLAITLRAILLTHGHGDHIAAVGVVKDKYQIPLYVGKDDQALLANPSDIVSEFYGHPVQSPPADFFVSDEQLLTFGSITLRVLSTPGHTPGGVCYLDEREGILFCGDTLFYGSIGRTDLLGASYEQLIDSIQTKILTLPDEIVCFPGHGPKTTVGAERNNNPFLKGGYAV